MTYSVCQFDSLLLWLYLTYSVCQFDTCLLCIPSDIVGKKGRRTHRRRKDQTTAQLIPTGNRAQIVATTMLSHRQTMKYPHMYTQKEEMHNMNTHCKLTHATIKILNLFRDDDDVLICMMSCMSFQQTIVQW